MEYTVNGKLYTTPATLYGMYLGLTYLLPEDSRQWGFTLYDVFFNALTKKVRKGVNESKTYVRPYFTRIITRSQQRDALVLLKNEEQRVCEALKEQEEMFKETCRDFYSPGKGNPANGQKKSSHGTFQYEADQHSNITASPVLRYGTSATEDTIARAQGIQPNSCTDVYPKCPFTGRASDFRLEFRGCVNCGDPGHAFRDCADRNSLEAKSRFHSNFNAHKPHITAARELRQSQQSGDKRPRPSERAQSHYSPGDATARQHESQAQSRSCEPVRRVYQTFVHRAITLHGSTTLNKREMPITVQNNLPTLSLHLGDSSN
jgi:hypothetical protein